MIEKECDIRIEVYRGSLDSQASSTGTIIVEQQLKAYEITRNIINSNRRPASLVWPSLRLFRSFVTSVVNFSEGGRVTLAEATQESVKKLPASLSLRGG